MCVAVLAAPFDWQTVACSLCVVAIQPTNHPSIHSSTHPTNHPFFARVQVSHTHRGLRRTSTLAWPRRTGEQASTKCTHTHTHTHTHFVILRVSPLFAVELVLLTSCLLCFSFFPSFFLFFLAIVRSVVFGRSSSACCSSGARPSQQRRILRSRTLKEFTLPACKLLDTNTLSHLRHEQDNGIVATVSLTNEHLRPKPRGWAATRCCCCC